MLPGRFFVILEFKYFKNLFNFFPFLNHPSMHVSFPFIVFNTEEDIAIEELKMMQFCHVNSLLKNYKMGVRIRFEYNFISWRNKVGLPLKEIQSYCTSTSCCNNCQYFKSIDQNGYKESLNNDSTSKATTKKRKTSNNDLLKPNEPIETNDTQPLLSPHSTKSEKPSSRHNTLNDSILTPITVLETALPTTNHTEDELENENCTLYTLRDFLSASLEKSPPPPKFPSRATSDKCPVSLKQILELSGPRGISILNFYNEQNHLTNDKRCQLIQLIVDFFDENDYHLSLNMSHNLEWEILKMFPHEKLEYYRTEKRGKIYVKFCNLKRYKRERNNKAKSENEIKNFRPRRTLNRNHHLDGFVVEENTTDMDNDDNGMDWPAGAEVEIEVKEETIELV